MSLLARWLATAALGLALVVMAAGPGFHATGDGVDAGLASAATRNQFIGAYLLAAGHSRRNASEGPAFEWTNSRPLLSSNRPISRVETLFVRP